MFCREWLAQLERHKEKLTSTGLKIVSVGIGEPQHASVCVRMVPNTVCLANETMSAYKDYGFTEMTMGDWFTPNLIKNGVRAVARVSVPGKATGNQQMVGGNFVIDRQGVVRYAYYSRIAGDHPSMKDILKTAQNL
jgi:hypothetical protein